MPQPLRRAIGTLAGRVCFDDRGPMSAIPVGPSAPLSAVTADGEELSGVISIAAGQLSPSAVCYLWLWACLYSWDDARSMELRYMGDAVDRELSAVQGLAASYRLLGEDGDMRPVTVFPAVHWRRRRVDHRAAFRLSVPARRGRRERRAGGKPGGRGAGRGTGQPPFHADYLGPMGGGAPAGDES